MSNISVYFISQLLLSLKILDFLVLFLPFDLLKLALVLRAHGFKLRINSFHSHVIFVLNRFDFSSLRQLQRIDFLSKFTFDRLKGDLRFLKSETIVINNFSITLF